MQKKEMTMFNFPKWLKNLHSNVNFLKMSEFQIIDIWMIKIKLVFKNC